MKNKKESIDSYLVHRVEGTVNEKAIDFVESVAEMYMIGRGRGIEDISFSLASLSAAVANIVMFELLGDPEEGPIPLTQEYSKFKQDFTDSMKVQLDDAAREILRNGGGLSDEDIEKIISDGKITEDDLDVINMMSKVKKFDA